MVLHAQNNTTDIEGLWFMGCEFKCQLCQYPPFHSESELSIHIVRAHSKLIKDYASVVGNNNFMTCIRYHECKICHETDIFRSHEHISSHLLQKHQGLSLIDYESNYLFSKNIAEGNISHETIQEKENAQPREDSSLRPNNNVENELQEDIRIHEKQIEKCVAKAEDKGLEQESDYTDEGDIIEFQDELLNFLEKEGNLEDNGEKAQEEITDEIQLDQVEDEIYDYMETLGRTFFENLEKSTDNNFDNSLESNDNETERRNSAIGSISTLRQKEKENVPSEDSETTTNTEGSENCLSIEDQIEENIHDRVKLHRRRGKRKQEIESELEIIEIEAEENVSKSFQKSNKLSKGNVKTVNIQNNVDTSLPKGDVLNKTHIQGTSISHMKNKKDSYEKKDNDGIVKKGFGTIKITPIETLLSENSDNSNSTKKKEQEKSCPVPNCPTTFKLDIETVVQHMMTVHNSTLNNVMDIWNQMQRDNEKNTNFDTPKSNNTQLTPARVLFQEGMGEISSPESSSGKKSTKKIKDKSKMKIGCTFKDEKTCIINSCNYTSRSGMHKVRKHLVSSHKFTERMIREYWDVHVYDLMAHKGL